MSGWTALAIPGAVLIVLSHTKGDISVAGPIVSLVWIGYGIGHHFGWF